ncbi:MAG: TetR/AcrR family transcriptional regulator [Hyphomicrobiales bacterium]|nr:TetR/AcrR family transcriptional regulator [Hyphomicrobiales bacterium]
MAVIDAEAGAQSDLKSEISSLKRQRVMDAATKLFAAQGFYGTSVDAIATAIGVTKPFVYYHFKDKADILAAICRRGADLTLSAMKAAETERGTAAEQFAFFCRNMTEIVIDHSHFLAVYNREIHALRDADRRSILRTRTEIDRRVAALIDVGCSNGEFDVDDLAVTAVSITMMLSNLWIWYRENRTGTREQVVEAQVRLALRMVGAKDVRTRLEPGKRKSGRMQWARSTAK